MTAMLENPNPDLITEDKLEYLDELRESGVTNMFDGGRYLEAEFGLTKSEARQVLVYWMQTFGDRHPRGEETSDE